MALFQLKKFSTIKPRLPLLGLDSPLVKRVVRKLTKFSSHPILLRQQNRRHPFSNPPFEQAALKFLYRFGHSISLKKWFKLAMVTHQKTTTITFLQFAQLYLRVDLEASCSFIDYHQIVLELGCHNFRQCCHSYNTLFA